MYKSWKKKFLFVKCNKILFLIIEQIWLKIIKKNKIQYNYLLGMYGLF